VILQQRHLKTHLNAKEQMCANAVDFISQKNISKCEKVLSTDLFLDFQLGIRNI